MINSIKCSELHGCYASDLEKFDLATYLADQKRFIDSHLEQWIATIPDVHRIKQAMAYSLFSGGKRMRPILCLAAARTVGNQGIGNQGKSIQPEIINAACAIELIHTYSLIHDDLPAMDDDQLRRGRPTCHLKFDEATAILAGDALLTLAFQILAADKGGDTPIKARLSVIETISQAAGPHGMVEGQLRDLTAEGRNISLDNLKRLHGLKTGALILSSLMAGADLSEVSPTRRESLSVYGHAIGLAYQVTDDILNVEGDPEMLGKAVGTDAQRQKSTYPSLLGLSESKELAKSLVNDALQALDAFDKRADPLRAIAQYIITRRR